MNQLSRSVSTRGVFIERLKMFNRCKLYQPSNLNQLALPYHPKNGQLV